MWLALLKFLLPILLKELVASGAMTKLEAAGIQTLEDFYVWVKGLKVYREYPIQAQKFAPVELTPNNISPAPEQDDAYPRPRS